MSSQATADSLSDVTNFTLFGWSLATHDFDNNGHNGEPLLGISSNRDAVLVYGPQFSMTYSTDLAIGVPQSSAVVLFR